MVQSFPRRGKPTDRSCRKLAFLPEEHKQNLINYGDKLTFGKASAMGTDNGVTVASIPTNIWEMWRKETGGAIEKDPKLLAKYLNDPDNKYFRTTPTRI